MNGRHPLTVMWMPPEARLPLSRLPSLPVDALANHKSYLPVTIAPRTTEEAEALRAWVSTHQSMFLTVGAASTAIAIALDRVPGGDYSLAERCLRLAAVLRRASAVYTYLPTVTRAVYEAYLRPAMTQVRPSFSGVSSREAIEFDRLVSGIGAIDCRAAQQNCPELERTRAEC